MDCLKDRDVIAQLFRMMAEHGWAEQLRELTRLIAAVDSMEQQFQVLQAELREVKKVQEMEVPAAGIGERLRAVRDHILTWAQTTVNDIGRMGISALDNAVSALDVLGRLEAVQDKVCGAMDRVDASIQKIETVGRELRTAGGHLKNAGRAVAGKETRQTGGDPEGHIQSAVLAPIRSVRTMLYNLNGTRCTAEDAVERLNHSAEQNRGKREKVSVRSRLEKKPALPAVNRPQKQYEAAR